MKPSACLLILNYNGQEHLKECLPSAFAATRIYDSFCPVIVVDNGSTEDDISYIRSHFPEVERESLTFFSMDSKPALGGIAEYLH